jgi:hypothetical protein
MSGFDGTDGQATKMKKIFWIILLLGAYIWVVSTGREELVLDQSKRIYHVVATWFSDAEMDFQVHQKPIPVKKKRPRRWD